jgi:hypothetical protein
MAPVSQGILVADPLQEALVPSAPPPQEVFVGMLMDQQPDINTAIDQGTGGMVFDRRESYETSWYLEGGTFREDGYTYIIQSTAGSNRASREEDAFAYNHLEVWCQKGEVVSVSNPRATRAYLVSSARTFFASRMEGVPWEGFDSMEAVLDHLGLRYSRFICGYSLRQRGLDEKFCALDWYFQDPDLRMEGRDLWYHAYILDQVCPSSWYSAQVVKNDGDLYRGWSQHALGQVYHYVPASE